MRGNFLQKKSYPCRQDAQNERYGQLREIRRSHTHAHSDRDREDGLLLLFPLWDQHFHRPRMGGRQGQPVAVLPERSRHRRLVPRGRFRRRKGRHFDRQTPRRILPLADGHDRLFGAQQPVEGRQGRRRRDARRQLPQVRLEDGRVSVAVGPQQPQVRHGRIRRLLLRAIDRALDALRRHVHRVAGRRVRLAPRRQADATL